MKPFVVVDLRQGRQLRQEKPELPLATASATLGNQRNGAVPSAPPHRGGFRGPSSASHDACTSRPCVAFDLVGTQIVMQQVPSAHTCRAHGQSASEVDACVCLLSLRALRELSRRTATTRPCMDIPQTERSEP